jgi:hypothetical protein
VTTDLIVDLRGKRIETLDDFWDAVSGPCELPSWFGRNVEAWRDTIQTRGISSLIDRHDTWLSTSKVKPPQAGSWSGPAAGGVSPACGVSP